MPLLRNMALLVVGGRLAERIVASEVGGGAWAQIHCDDAGTSAQESVRVVATGSPCCGRVG
jgi:hypothetical protein